MIPKRILVPDRVRHLPKTDWAWVDRRFLRDFAPKLSGDAVFLYYLLIAASDKNGLSFYGEHSLARMLRTSQSNFLKARQELVDWSLIAYEAPLTQVLALPPLGVNVLHRPSDSHVQKAASDSHQQLIELLASNKSIHEAKP